MPLKVENISYTYQRGTPYEKKALNNISLEIKDKSIVGIMGPAGSGKTTLLQIIAGLLAPHKGQITIDGNPNSNKKNVGLVFQFPEMQFVQDTVGTEIAYGLTFLKLSKSEIKSRVENSMDLVGLPWTEYKNKRLTSLSSGEKRRVALATILALENQYLLLDEPTAGLDYLGRQDLHNTLLDLKANNRTIVLVSHNLSYLFSISDVIYLMSEGQIIMTLSKNSGRAEYVKLNDLRYQLPAYLETVIKLQQKGWEIELGDWSEATIIKKIAEQVNLTKDLG